MLLCEICEVSLKTLNLSKFLKAALIIFISKTAQMSMRIANRVTHSDKPPENYHPYSAFPLGSKVVLSGLFFPFFLCHHSVGFLVQTQN